MASFEESAQRLTADGENTVLPGFTAVAADDKGSIRYVNSFGTTATGPLTLDTPIWLASCTKLMTAIAVLQCVERGLLDLDEDISRLLPEFAEPDILYGFDEKTGQPLLRKAKRKITLRHLLTHSSGLGYDMLDPRLLKWKAAKGEVPTIIPKDINDYFLPLLFEPGEGFIYGVGLDWAGKAIERANGNMRLGDFMKKNIWEPLGMQRTAFRLEENDYLRENIGELTVRTDDGNILPMDRPWRGVNMGDDFGGVGVITTASDYLKVQISLLKNDGKLLKAESVDLLFAPQLEDTKYIMEVLRSDDGKYAPGMTNGLTSDTEWNYALGGIVAVEETPGRRSKGVISWAGMSNPIWFIDRERGICGFWAIQLFPFFDPQHLELFGKFENMVWERFGKKKEAN
ncbi:hypothetical protein AJ80_03410 [Polytolypa hystricis UAMH7299]|uniref:Beta-lactamase-related domain-containing protein n=1 Tax=Polytolypa hystricis (strain UAMH7299) TaxID=1447883 RepID=A0A2B7YID9_POLH7|nr:hypothetical protein AJ80_03410 [Polytolypa hystricis UAMH7299]